ncbi:MAG TPA: prepilin-type N-terminal cleavage/methylation domain-containing protein [Candidatus Omnitrophota bacterium]|nr:prepilin-type N-terminal cleavage/methylation domain-containing protein [Candidatus Omnitrophota bacterium]
MKLNTKSGFTLLEIIIVIIIIGVLASLALPKFFQTINFAKSTEALNTLGELKRAADRCAMMSGAGSANYSTCGTPQALGLESVNTTTWNYVFITPTYDTWGVNAKFAGEGAGAGNEIGIRIASNEIVTKTGTGIFSGIK